MADPVEVVPEPEPIVLRPVKRRRKVLVTAEATVIKKQEKN